ncbi:MAG: hypothetical protein JWQ30_2437 [Sediminibacterium sp.]|nr:hypothetical protein [Sediminibacterium sp.]
MREEVYEDLKANYDFSMFEFSSIGRRGIILKRIEFTSTGLNGVFNLAFGDIGIDGEIDDNCISNNGDRNKILATVVDVVLKYTEKYPDRFIFFTGNSPARTRLYRMAITAHLEDLSGVFDIFISVRDDIMPFQKNTNVNSFLIKRKIV